MSEPRVSIGAQLDELDDRRDLARYRWLRQHFRFQDDSQYEIWFDEHLTESDNGVMLDRVIDNLMRGHRNG